MAFPMTDRKIIICPYNAKNDRAPNYIEYYYLDTRASYDRTDLCKNKETD